MKLFYIASSEFLYPLENLSGLAWFHLPLIARSRKRVRNDARKIESGIKMDSGLNSWRAVVVEPTMADYKLVTDVWATV
jgi:hypothetical protein